MGLERWVWRLSFEVFRSYFFWLVKGRFCRGFCEKVVFLGGIFVVNLW